MRRHLVTFAAGFLAGVVGLLGFANAMVEREWRRYRATSVPPGGIRYVVGAVQIEWPGQAPLLIAAVSPGLYWISTAHFDTRHERFISREALEDHWPPEVLELVDAA